MEELINSVGLTDCAKKPAKKLSGGEQQRMCFARSVANRPRYLFADEPTGNLDSNNGERILSLLKEANANGATVVLATHDREAMRCGNRFFRLNDGRLIDEMSV